MYTVIWLETNFQCNIFFEKMGVFFILSFALATQTIKKPSLKLDIAVLS